MALTLLDRWIRHFAVRDGVLVMRHDAGKLALPVKEISSHKHVSFARVVIRLFSGHRYDLSIVCFRSEEIEGLMKTLRQISRENRVRV
jgi:hypothetical protein